MYNIMLKGICAFVLFLLLGYLFFLKNAYAQDVDYNSLFETTESNDSAAENNKNIEDWNAIHTAFELEFKGDHMFRYVLPSGEKKYRNYEDKKAPRYLQELGFEIKDGKVKAVSNWKIDAIIEEDEEDNEQNNVIVDTRVLENYIQWQPGSFLFGFGFQEYAWGTGDDYNPSDNLNPQDYTVGVTSDKIPVFSASCEYFPVDSFSFQLVYIPYYQASIFEDDTEEYMKTLLQNEHVTTEEPSYSPSSCSIGVKMNFYLQDIDFSFGYMYDYDDYYSARIELAQGTEYTLGSMELVRDRLHHFSADFRSSIDRYGVWGEFCYTMTEDYNMDSYEKRNHRFSWLLGIDRNYGEEAEHRVNFQCVGEYIPLYDTSYYDDYINGEPDTARRSDREYMREYYYRTYNNQLAGYSQRLLLGGLINAEWSFFKSFFNPEITIGYFYPIHHYLEDNNVTQYGSLILQPEIDIMPYDSFHVIIGAELVYSWQKRSGEDIEINETDRFGRYYKDNRIFFEVQHKWNYILKK